VLDAAQRLVRYAVHNGYKILVGSRITD
jgi:hypothetical protein